MKIVYMQDNGMLAIVVLADETNIIEDAPQHVPLGKRYKIIEEAELPADTQYRDAWAIDDADLTDGVGIMA